jgi:CheY-like chemotaxis protein
MFSRLTSVEPSMADLIEEAEHKDESDVDIQQMAAGRELVYQLFRALGVSKLVVVDDDYEVGVGDDQFLEALGFLVEQNREAVFELIGADVNSGIGWFDAAREQIAKWDAGTRLKYWDLLTNKYSIKAPRFRGNIADLTDGVCELLQLSPTQWDRQRARLITDAHTGEKKGTGRTLFLFDLDLADKHPRGLNGRQLLEELRTEIRHPSVLCGILSGKYAKEDEAEAAEAGGAVNPPVYLAKERLEEEPASFAHGVRRTALVEIVTKVIAKAIGVLDGAQVRAKEDLGKLNANNFERVVLQISQQEGIWEADTIFRIFGIYQRKAARSRARGDGELDDALEKMRTIGGIGADAAPKDEPQELKRIQALEMYESPEDLNPHFLPIELGDIFAISGGNAVRHFILLGQPCDLSLRPPKKGKPEVATRNLWTPWLVELVEHGKKGPDRNAQAAHYQLPYIREDLGPLWADYRSLTPASLDILDLCAFHREGTAIIDVADEPPAGLLHAWNLRYRDLREKYRHEIQRRELAEAFITEAEQRAPVPDAVRKQLLSAPGTPFPILGDPNFDGTCVRFDCQRVRRLVQPHAGFLLIKFAHHISREAFDVDLGRDT